MPDFGPQPKQFSNTDSYPGIVPIGGCIPWDPAVVGSPEPTLPAGWEYCDGGTVTTVGSPKFGQTKPALMRTVANPGVTPRFIRGADTTSAYGGGTALTTGGSATHTHTEQGAGGFTPSGTIGGDGSHSHSGNTGSVSLTNSGETNNFSPAGFAAGAQTVALNHTHTISPNPHTHTISVSGGTHSHTFSGNSVSNHTHTIDPANGEPPYVDMAWIMRVL